MKSLLNRVKTFFADSALRLVNFSRGLWRRLRQVPRGKVVYYGALALLLVILGAASYGYRNRTRVSHSAEQAEPLSALAVQTPAPPVPTPQPTPEPMRFVWPVEGDILVEYAPNALVWSQTLSQWQTHPAIDIAALPGEAVLACADGIIDDAWVDTLWGNVVVIRHDEGYMSTYANLNTLNLAPVGKRVAAGEIIGAIGQSASCESASPWHLHFELQQNGAPVDFEVLMAK